jgi:hypothetical protein
MCRIDAEAGTFRFEFFQVVDSGYAVGGFNFQNNFMYVVQGFLTAACFFRSLAKLLENAVFMPCLSGF